MITHQEIIDRLEALGTEHSKAYESEQARQRKERAVDAVGRPCLCSVAHDLGLERASIVGDEQLEIA